MAMNTPQGDKMNLDDTNKAKKGGKKGRKPIDKDNSESTVSSDVSFDSFENNILPYDSDFDDAANYLLLQKHFDQKLLLLQTEFQGQINALHGVIKNKDEVIGKLHTEIGELKQSCNFLSNETTTIGKRVVENEIALSSSIKDHNELVNKAADLEDRSRRNNLVFFNIPEPASESTDKEDCDSIIINLLKARGFFGPEYTLEIDRAHRLGRKKEDSFRPRPIIVRFSFFKDKELIIKSGRLFKGCEVTASEDFSKMTLEIHKQLRSHAKEAQSTLESTAGQNISIVHHRVTYRRVILTYKNKNGPSLPTFTRSFTLQYINSNKKWYLPPSRTTYSNVSKPGNQ